MAAITAASGTSMTLVESSSPPMPTSSTTMSQRCPAKYTMARAVISSNSVGASSMASAKGRIRSVSSASSPSGICSWSICIRSLKRLMKGEVYRPTLYPASSKMEASMAAVEPLPLVPAIWMNFSFFSGFPSLPSSSRVRSSPSLLPFQHTEWM